MKILLHIEEMIFYMQCAPLLLMIESKNNIENDCDDGDVSISDHIISKADLLDLVWRCLMIMIINERSLEKDKSNIITKISSLFLGYSHRDRYDNNGRSDDDLNIKENRMEIFRSKANENKSAIMRAVI